MGPDYASHKPYGVFFDKPVPDNAASSTRPRFKNAIFLRKIPSAPGLKVRDIFERAMEEGDEMEFPEAWEHYQKQRQKIDRKTPPLEGIPGIDPVAIEEFKALELTDCRMVADYEGELDVLAPLRETAKQIMRVADGKVPEERQAVQSSDAGPVHGNPCGHWASAEKGEEEKTFTYSFNV